MKHFIQRDHIIHQDVVTHYSALPYLVKPFFSLTLLVLLTLLVGCGGGGGNSLNEQVLSTTNSNDIENNDIEAFEPNAFESDALVSMVNLDVAWNLPQYRLDGTALEPYEIRGYHLYIGSSADALDQHNWIDDPLQTSSVISATTSADSDQMLYIAIAVEDIFGTKSNLSPVQAIHLGS